MQHFDEGKYHNSQGYVYVGPWACELDAVWCGIDNAECRGISLELIGRSLSFNWPATVVALAFGNIATLRTLIDEASKE